MKMNQLFINLFVSTLIVLLTLEADAMRVAQVKGRRVLINLEQATANPGDRFFIMNPQGKRIGLVEVRQVRGKAALAALLKGGAPKGALLEPMKPVAATAATPRTARSASKFGIGGVLGLSMNTFGVSDIITTDGLKSPSLSGNSFNFGVVGDYFYSPSISARVIGGVESLKAESPEISPIDGEKFNINISYLGLSALGRYHFLPGRYNMWAGAGFNFMLATSKSSNTVETGPIQYHSTIPIAAGLDFEISPNSYAPIQFEYNIWLQPGNISVSTMIIRAGYALRF